MTTGPTTTSCHQGERTPEGHDEYPGPRLVVLGGTGRLVEAAHALGVDVVLVVDIDGDVPVQARVATHVLRTRVSDDDAVHEALAPLHAERPFSTVLSLTEAGLVPAARLRRRLGLPGNSVETVEVLKDKCRMRALLDEQGLSPVSWASPRDAQELAAFCREVGGPVILKPRDGAGSRAVHRVLAPRDAEAAWDSFLRSGGTDATAEEFLEGPEVSVESFTHRGRHHVLAVTDKIVDAHFVELGHTMPSRLPTDVTAAVTALVEGVLDAVGLAEGPAHTEVKVTPSGPRVIESHDRIGGDRIRVLLQIALGVDLPTATVTCALGLGPAPAPALDVARGAAVRFVTAAPGPVRRVEVPTVSSPWEARVDVHVGDVVRPVRRSGDRLGYVIADGADADEAAREADSLLDRVAIVTRAGE